MIEIKSLSNYRKRTIIAVAIFFAFAGGVKWCTSAAFAADTKASVGEHVVTIHDKGEQIGIVTSASTLRDVFKQANIAVSDRDLTEPSLDTTLVSGSYEVNIYRARPIVIKDGAKSVSVVSAYRTPKQIVKQAGITLNDADTTAMRPATDIIKEGAAEVLTIDRATPVVFVFYGKTIQTSTRATTVEQFLKERNVTATASDTVSPAAGTPITAGMTVELWHNGKQSVTVDEDVAFTTREVQDANHDKGYHEVQTQGQNGKRTVTYEIEMRNGQEVSRKEANAIVTKQPVEQVEIVGTKVSLPAGSHEDWMAAAGIAPSDYGYVNYIVMHEGGWEPCKVQGGAINCDYSGSMGYGLVQATPGSKMVSAGADWRTNPITQLRWATGYAVGRYGSWAGAYNHWLASHNW